MKILGIFIFAILGCVLLVSHRTSAAEEEVIM